MSVASYLNRGAITIDRADGDFEVEEDLKVGGKLVVADKIINSELTTRLSNIENSIGGGIDPPTIPNADLIKIKEDIEELKTIVSQLWTAVSQQGT